MKENDLGKEISQKRMEIVRVYTDGQIDGHGGIDSARHADIYIYKYIQGIIKVFNISSYGAIAFICNLW